MCLRDGRGQTNIDLILAITLFLGVLTTIFIGSPDLFLAQSIYQDDHTPTADRVAQDLQTETLSEEHTNKLSQQALISFAAIDSQTELRNEIDLDDDYDARITIYTVTDLDNPQEPAVPRQEPFRDEDDQLSDPNRAGFTQETTDTIPADADIYTTHAWFDERQITIEVAIWS